MVALMPPSILPSSLNGRLLPAIAILTGIGVAAGIATAPANLLDRAIDGSGVGSLIGATSAPIGVTGRTLLALAIGTLVGMLGFVGHARRLLPVRALRDAAVTVRRADAHPDAPPRRPIRASEDLGDPLAGGIGAEAPETEAVVRVEPVERDLPKDLDLPLCAFDPTALPLTPREPVRPVAPLARRPVLIDPGERFETFPLAPPPPASSQPAGAAPRAGESIQSLIDRLERSALRRGAARQVPTPRESFNSLDDTLQKLRRLATS